MPGLIFSCINLSPSILRIIGVLGQCDKWSLILKCYSVTCGTLSHQAAKLLDPNRSVSYVYRYLARPVVHSDQGRLGAMRPKFRLHTMNNYINHDTDAVPPGHEKVSDDLLIYSLPNWSSHPDSGDELSGDHGQGGSMAVVTLGGLALLGGFLLLP